MEVKKYRKISGVSVSKFLELIGHPRYNEQSESVYDSLVIDRILYLKKTKNKYPHQIRNQKRQWVVVPARYNEFFKLVFVYKDEKNEEHIISLLLDIIEGQRTLILEDGELEKVWADYKHDAYLSNRKEA